MKFTKPTFLLVLLLPALGIYGCGQFSTDPQRTLSDNAPNSSRIAPANDQNLSEEQRRLYRRDAEILAARYINETDSTRTGIPVDLINLMYNGLVHLVNSDHPEAKQATQSYPVHARNPSPREILVYADSTAAWVNAWRNEKTETGNSNVDDLIDLFDLTLAEFNELHDTSSNVMARLRTSHTINVFAVGRMFEKLNDIENAHPDFRTDGSDITVLFFDDFLRFNLTYRFGDCQSACNNEHIWKFNVHNDGTVEFIDEDGDTLPA